MPSSLFFLEFYNHPTAPFLYYTVPNIPTTIATTTTFPLSLKNNHKNAYYLNSTTKNHVSTDLIANTYPQEDWSPLELHQEQEKQVTMKHKNPHFDPRCNPFHPKFDPYYALLHPTQFLYPCKRFPLYDNVAQYSYLIYSSTGLNLLGLCQHKVHFSDWVQHCIRLHVLNLQEKLRKLEVQRISMEQKQCVQKRDIQKFTILKVRELQFLLALKKKK